MYTGQPLRFSSLGGDEVRPRRHGFESPLDPLQVAGWISIVVIFVMYFAMIGPVLQPFAAAFATSAILFVLGVAVTVLKILLSLLPSEDPRCYGPQMTRAELMDRSHMPDGTSVCNYCRRWTHRTSRHCSICDKCCVGFDHHCRWLNVCVGSRTYVPFFVFVTVTLAALLLSDAATIVVVAQCFSQRAQCEVRLRQMYGAFSIEAFQFFAICLALYTTLGVGVIGHLWSFHVRLIVSGKTTYEVIEEEKAAARAAATAAVVAAQPTKGCCAEAKRRDFKAEGGGAGQAGQPRTESNVPYS